MSADRGVSSNIPTDIIENSPQEVDGRLKCPFQTGRHQLKEKKGWLEWFFEIFYGSPIPQQKIIVTSHTFLAILTLSEFQSQNCLTFYFTIIPFFLVYSLFISCDSEIIPLISEYTSHNSVFILYITGTFFLQQTFYLAITFYVIILSLSWNSDFISLF